MRNDDVKLRCHKCGNEYSSRDMRQSPFGPNLICRNCLEGKRPVKSGFSIIAKKPVVAQEKITIQPKKDMISYTCTNCKYTFKRKRGAELERCPYCDTEGSITMNKGTAQTLIEESSKRQYDY